MNPAVFAQYQMLMEQSVRSDAQRAEDMEEQARREAYEKANDRLIKERSTPDSVIDAEMRATFDNLMLQVRPDPQPYMVMLDK